MNRTDIDDVRDCFLDLHTCGARLWQELDAGSVQRRDEWQQPADTMLAGSGRLALIENGEVFDRAGIGFSDVQGQRLPAAASERHRGLAGLPFRALGTSCIVHARNPHVPTAHMNVRFFISQDGAAWWFGGGFDLTPVYPYLDDVVRWHLAARAACEPAGPRVYPVLKQACDRYFYLPHRAETRGVGGLFAEDLNEETPEIGGRFEDCFALVRRIGDTFLTAYRDIVQRRRHTPFGPREQEFQWLRRGRYVEFNLAFDRGTRFGLQARTRTESCLISMPPRAEWRYDFRPQPGSPEAALGDFLRPRDWLAAAP